MHMYYHQQLHTSSVKLAEVPLSVVAKHPRAELQKEIHFNATLVHKIKMFRCVENK